MRIECIDLETFRFQPGEAAPTMVCMSWSNGEREKLLVPWEGESPHEWFEKIVRRRDTLIINQSVFFDLGVLCAERPHLIPLVFEAIEAGLIRCVKVREQLIRIALGEAKFVETRDDGGDEDEDEDGEDDVSDTSEPVTTKTSYGHRIMAKTRFDLAATAQRWLGIKVKKEGTWRMSYALLYKEPLANWPHDAIEYPLIDARTPIRVWNAQDSWVRANFTDGKLPGEVEANCAALALHLMKVWGVRTCPEAVKKLTEEMESKVFWSSLSLVLCGIMRQGGTKAKPKAVSTKAEVQRRVAVAFAAKNLEVPITAPTKKFPSGQIKTSRKVLEDSKIRRSRSSLITKASRRFYRRTYRDMWRAERACRSTPTGIRWSSRSVFRARTRI